MKCYLFYVWTVVGGGIEKEIGHVEFVTLQSAKVLTSFGCLKEDVLGCRTLQ